MNQFFFLDHDHRFIGLSVELMITLCLDSLDVVIPVKDLAE